MLSKQNKAIALVLASLLGVNFSGCSKDSDTAAVVAAAVSLGLIADTYYTLGNLKLTISAADGILANDTDAPVVTHADDTSAMGGTVSMNLDGSFTYNPPLGFSGTDTFTYSVETTTQTVTIIVENVVWFVMNNAAAGGDGTQDAPFDSLSDAEAASSAEDFIYIYNGDGTTVGQASGVTLKDNQKLIGEGVALETTTGVELIAAGSAPVITNVAGNAVDLAENNEIKGLIIDSPTSKGIAGSAITGLSISDSEINSAGGRAIEILGSNGTFSFHNLMIDSNAGDGIHLTTASTDVASVSISDSTIKDGTFDGICLGASGSSSLTATISMTAVSGYSDNGIEVSYSGSSTGSTTINSSSSSNDNLNDGVAFTTASTANASLIASSSTFSSNSSDGLDIQSDDSSTLSVTLTSNKIDDNSDEGIEIDSNSSSTFEFTASSNTLDSNSSSGIEIDSNSSSTLGVVLAGNTLTGNGIYGVEVDANSSSQFCADIDANSVDSDIRLDQNSISLFELALGTNSASVLTSGTILTVPSGSCF